MRVHTHSRPLRRAQVTENFLPLDRPVRIGVTSGASTPDSVVQECLERIVMLKKLGRPTGGANGGAEGAGQDAPLEEVAEPVTAANPMGPPPLGFEWGELL